MKHLRRSICVYEIEIGTQKISREYISYKVIVEKNSGTLVHNVRPASVYPCFLIYSKWRHISDNSVTDPSHRHQRKLRVLVSVHQLPWTDLPTQPTGRGHLRSCHKESFQVLTTVCKVGLNSTSKNRTRKSAGISDEGSQECGPN